MYVSVISGAGNETTNRLIGWMGKVLAEHPDQRREFVEDRSLVPNAIEELLRFEPPTPHVARYVARDVELSDQTVPAGSAIICLTGSANRDDHKYEDPDRFDIHRNIRQHLTFGYGIHFCLGAALARLEGPGHPRRGPDTLSRMGGRLGERPKSPDVDRARLGLACRSSTG